MKDPRLDRHLVAHDVGVLALASIFGAVGTAVTQSLTLGMLMTGAAITLGVLIMRITPLRRGVNRLALAALSAVH